MRIQKMASQENGCFKEIILVIKYSPKALRKIKNFSRFFVLQAHKHKITKVSTYNYGKLNATYDMYAYVLYAYAYMP